MYTCILVYTTTSVNVVRTNNGFNVRALSVLVCKKKYFTSISLHIYRYKYIEITGVKFPVCHKPGQ